MANPSVSGIDITAKRYVANATLAARFGAVEELMREMRNDLREMNGRQRPR